jgi:hypothetical protein
MVYIHEIPEKRAHFSRFEDWEPWYLLILEYFHIDRARDEEAALLLQEWSTPEGGFILSDYGDGDAIGVPLARKRVMLDAFARLAAPAIAAGTGG